jgi:hypothetical protein
MAKPRDGLNFAQESLSADRSAKLGIQQLDSD